MKVSIVHNSIIEEDGPDARDVLAQVEAVRKALVHLGHRVEVFDCSLNLEEISDHLRETESEMVFNLVESLGGQGSLLHLFPALLEALRIPYTGSSAEALRITSHKTEAKEIIQRAGLPTPDWIGPVPGSGEKIKGEVTSKAWIIKPLWEHASLGIGPDAVVRPSSAERLFRLLDKRAEALGKACFAEHFIDGREFNISLLAEGNGPEVLAPAEILFNDFESHHIPRIVDYTAKWDKSSFSYHHTPRRFVFGKENGPLIKKLEDLSRQCWDLFGLKGYARVDFRVDRNGRPWILEVNANPCLSPNAGFAAALTHAGLPFTEAVRRIIKDIR